MFKGSVAKAVNQLITQVREYMDIRESREWNLPSETTDRESKRDRK